jgi:hypothetical protein
MRGWDQTVFVLRTGDCVDVRQQILAGEFHVYDYRREY